jgi:hypothetical protein
MGFTKLELMASDEASWSMDQVLDAMAKALRKEAKRQTTQWNTPGYMNVILIWEELILPSKYMHEWGGAVIGILEKAWEELNEDIEAGHWKGFRRAFTLRDNLGKWLSTAGGR